MDVAGLSVDSVELDKHKVCVCDIGSYDSSLTDINERKTIHS